MVLAPEGVGLAFLLKKCVKKERTMIVRSGILGKGLFVFDFVKEKFHVVEVGIEDFAFVGDDV